jgi:hypothetical protein
MGSGGSKEYSYKGEKRKGLKHGQGTLTHISDHSSYQGSFVEGMQEGRGVSVYPNGDIYEGDWVRDQRCGQGSLKSNDGVRIYEGGWKDDEMHGVCSVI